MVGFFIRWVRPDPESFLAVALISVFALCAALPATLSSRWLPMCSLCAFTLYRCMGPLDSLIVALMSSNMCLCLRAVVKGSSFQFLPNSGGSYRSGLPS
jgi:hypothetical protein